MYMRLTLNKETNARFHCRTPQKHHAELHPSRLTSNSHTTSGATKMIWNRRLLSVLALIGAVAFVSTAFAKHQHHNGQQLVGNKINTNGKHELHKVGEHAVSIQVANKKIAGVTVA